MERRLLFHRFYATRQHKHPAAFGRLRRQAMSDIAFRQHAAAAGRGR
jgi:hypothetical protein